MFSDLSSLSVWNLFHDLIYFNWLKVNYKVENKAGNVEQENKALKEENSRLNYRVEHLANSLRALIENKVNKKDFIWAIRTLILFAKDL